MNYMQTVKVNNQKATIFVIGKENKYSAKKMPFKIAIAINGKQFLA